MIVGIDLGTTNSLACYWQDEKVNMIPELGENENYILPSRLYRKKDGIFLVGNEANDIDISEYSNDSYFASFKNFMGTDKLYMIGDETYTPVDFSAMVLKKIKENAQMYLNEEISEAVISVPAYFNDRQRSDTKKAAQLAGLKVERLINEPSAAALAYRMNSDGGMKTIIVFDFGGGTLDISLVECFDNITEIIAIVGDNHLGGNDIDECIAREWCSETESDYDKLSPNKRYELLKEAEKFKCCEESSINISEEKLFYACAPLFSKIKKLIIKLLKDSDHMLSDIDDVVMVGGSSKWKMVQDFVAEIVCKEPVVVEHPEYTVAKGVGIYAGIRSRNEDIKDLVLTDVSPFTLGTAVVGRKNNDRVGETHMFPMIERNTTLPTSVTERFYTASDYQHEICFEVYQGEEYDVSNNLLLGSMLVDVPMRPAGEVYIDVTFNYDINGIIQVIVRREDGSEEEMVIANHEMDEKEIANRINKLRTLSSSDDKDKLILKKYISILEALYAEEHGVMREQISAVLEYCVRALSTGHIIERKKMINNIQSYLERINDGNLENIED